MSDEREPLWSDMRIESEVDDALWEEHGESRERARRLLREMRDDYEARLAQTWQPLPDGTYHTNNAEIFRVVDGDMITYAYGSTTRIEFYQGQAICRLVTKGEGNENSD